MPPVDPNEVLMTGENSFVRLSADGGKTLTDRTSHWRVLWCPGGAGHVLFIQSTLTDGKIRMARKATSSAGSAIRKRSRNSMQSMAMGPSGMK